MNRILISEDALSDLDEGFWFYEKQEAGLGDYFSACIRSDIEGLKISGGIHRCSYLEFRRCLSRVFPFAIYYSINESIVTVWAVVDCRRDPDAITKQLRNRG
jgi:hypothetical protein